MNTKTNTSNLQLLLEITGQPLHRPVCDKLLHIWDDVSFYRRFRTFSIGKLS